MFTLYICFQNNAVLVFEIKKKTLYFSLNLYLLTHTLLSCLLNARTNLVSPLLAIYSGLSLLTALVAVLGRFTMLSGTR